MFAQLSHSFGSSAKHNNLKRYAKMKVNIQTKELMVKYLVGEEDQETISKLTKSIKDDFTEEFLNIPMYNFEWIYANTKVYIGRNAKDSHKGSVVISLMNIAVEIFFRIKETIVVNNKESIYCVEVTTKDSPSKEFVDVGLPEVWYRVAEYDVFPISFKEAKDYKKRYKMPAEGLANSKRVTAIDANEIAEKLKGMKKGEILTIVVA